MASTNIKDLDVPEIPIFKTEKVRFNFDNNLKRWFRRNLGLWRSRRQYIFEDKEVFNVEMYTKFETIIDDLSGNERYLFSWWSDKDYDLFHSKPSLKKEGKIIADLLGHQLYQNNVITKDRPIISHIRQVDEHELIFESNEKSCYTLEHIRLIDNDRYRSRVIYTWENDYLTIVENCHEIRLSA